ncbi:hypothetical protein EOM86_11215 [Candidatus Nomurabacteria bacterium]|nr:hypothetical protein [Candidatus Nomurabacteria bacterium]
MAEIKIFPTEYLVSLFRGKTKYGSWIIGDLLQYANTAQIWTQEEHGKCNYIVDLATVGQFIGETDKNNKKIFKGDITELTLENGEIRRFVVDIRTVTRTLVSHPDFDDETAKVQITGVVFLWQGYELFPCIDSNGASDVSKMEVIGNIHDNPELMKEESE